MIGLLLLDHPSWWTALGSLIKYFSIICGVAAGVAMFKRSRGAYFGLGWMVVIVAPLVVLSSVKGAAGAAFIFARPSHEDIFIFVWLFLGLLELFLIWIPIVGLILGSGSNKNSPKAVSVAEDSPVFDQLECPSSIPVGVWREGLMRRKGITMEGESYRWKGRRFQSFQAVIDALRATKDA